MKPKPKSTKQGYTVFVSTDMTKAEQARCKLLVEQLKSRRARQETDIIYGDSIVTRYIP